MTTAEAVAKWRASSCWDSEGAPHELDWHDPVDVMAATLFWLTAYTPEDVAGHLTAPGWRETLERAWSKPTDHARKDRHLWRRRAIVALEAAGRAAS